ncbi:MAG: DMT family transporter [Gemmobacter sp.]|jgi:drug/metabolite transporter (DMT)-like permease|nr:DMT family transporter [Gemmobacter sp.]
MAMSDNARGAVLMNAAMLAFTLNDTCMKAVTETVPLFQSIFLRGILTTLALLGFGLARKGLRLRLAGLDARLIGLRTVAEILATIAFLGALTRMPLATLSAIMQSLPLAVTLAAALVFRDPIGWRRLLAIAVGFLGVLIIIRPGTEGFDRWSMLGLASVCCVVVRDLATRKLSAAVPSATVAIWAGAGVTALGLAGLLREGWQPLDGREALLILGASANLIIGYLTAVMVMRVGDIGFIAPFRYMALFWAILLGFAIFGTLPDHWTLVGTAIVVTTGLFTLWRERRSR